MLAAAVYPGKRLFRQKAYHAVLLGDPLHQLHGQLVAVRGNIGGGKVGGQLMLGGRYLIVLGFGHHPQLPQLLVQLLHVRAHTGLYRPEIVVIQLLSLGGLRPEQGAAGI